MAVGRGPPCDAAVLVHVEDALPSGRGVRAGPSRCPAVVKAVTSGPWSRRTATDPEGVDASSYFLRVAAEETAVTAPAAAGGVRTSRVQTEYDPDYGMPTKVSDLGNTAVTGDERCTATTYARNPGANIVDLVSGMKVSVSFASGTAAARTVANWLVAPLGAAGKVRCARISPTGSPGQCLYRTCPF